MSKFWSFTQHVATVALIMTPLTVVPLPAQDQGIGRERMFTVYAVSGRAIDVWLHSRADLDLFSAAASGLDTALLGPTARTATSVVFLPDAVFLSSQAVGSLDDADRSELRTLAEQGVPVICECGEFVLSRQIGFMPVEQASPDTFEFFVYSKTSAGVVRASFLLSGLPDGSKSGLPQSADTALTETAPRLDTTDSRVRGQLRASLLREALRRSLEDRAAASGQPEPARAASSGQNAAGELSWTKIADLSKEWSHVTPDVSCATDPPCWNFAKAANAFTVTADFYKIPDGRADTDYYLVNVRSHHDANYQVPYLNTPGYCSDGWVGWYVPERRLRLSLYAGDKASRLYQYGPTGTLKQQTVTYELGAGLDIGRYGGGTVNTSYSVSYLNSDAEVHDNSSLAGNYGNWTETFIRPEYNDLTHQIRDPSPVARESFFSLRSAIFSTSNPAAGIGLQIDYYAAFVKDRIDYSWLCSMHEVLHVWEEARGHGFTIRWNYPPDAPAKPNLTIPAGSTALWTNTPLAVNVPPTVDRDGDAVTYSVDFGDGTIGAYGAAAQTHSWTRPGTINLKVKARDTYGDQSSWSDTAGYTIKGLDRIQIDGLREIPELASMQLQCRAILSDGSSQEITLDPGWEGGVIRWSVSSPYAIISSAGVLQSLGVQGADRVITVDATYTLKGVEKRGQYTVLIKAVPPERLVPAISSVVNGASFLPGISGSAWVTIRGANLAGTARPWRGDEITGAKLPTALDGVSVTMNGAAAAISYVNPSQLNVQVPFGLADGPVTVRVTTPYGSATANAQVSRFSPEFFTFAGKYVAAQHRDYSFVAKRGLFGELITFPARPGEAVLLYATGFGPTTPELPSGEVITAPAPLANSVTVWIGGRLADVQWAGMSAAGLWQLNVAIPAGLAGGDHAVVAEVGGVRTQADVFITVMVGVGGPNE